jgi:hypothetical protein
MIQAFPEVIVGVIVEADPNKVEVADANAGGVADGNLVTENSGLVFLVGMGLVEE